MYFLPLRSLELFVPAPPRVCWGVIEEAAKCQVPAAVGNTGATVLSLKLPGLLGYGNSGVAKGTCVM